MSEVPIARMVPPVTSVIHGHPLGLGSLGIPARRACFVGTCCQPSSATCQEAKLKPSHWIQLDGVPHLTGHGSDLFFGVWISIDRLGHLQ